MLSRKELFESPHLYEPLGTVKSIRNKASNYPGQNNIIKLFTSSKNRLLLKRNLYRISNSNGSNDNVDFIANLVDNNINEYLATHDIKNYRMAEYQAVGFMDYTELLRYINMEFIKFCHPKLKWNQFNPFREYVEVGPSNDRREVKYNDVMASDLPTINIWANQDTSISSKRFRNSNQIPYFQAHMHQRHYDRDNEGFRVQSKNESSLETFISGYDMSGIHKTLNSWTKSDWFGL